MGLQALSGIAKDLTKMSSKSAIKFVAGDGDGALFKLVAILTGSKNALKGVGFFVGAALLSRHRLRRRRCGRWPACSPSSWSPCMRLLDEDIGRAKAKPPLRSILSKSPAINRLSAARFFLFGVARHLVRRRAAGLSRRRARLVVRGLGAFLAVWVIGYGIVQSLAPRLLAPSISGVDAEIARRRARWAFVLGVVVGRHRRRRRRSTSPSPP